MDNGTKQTRYPTTLLAGVGEQGKRGAAAAATDIPEGPKLVSASAGQKDILLSQPHFAAPLCSAGRHASRHQGNNGTRFVFL